MRMQIRLRLRIWHALFIGNAYEFKPSMNLLARAVHALMICTTR
jgi:hypothetical protein